MKNILKGKYKKKYEEVDSYCTLLLDNIDSNIRNDIMMDIYELFEDAQNKQLSIDDIIGDDVEKFCTKACSNLPRKYKIKYIYQLFKYCSLVILIFNCLDLAFNYNNNILSIKTDISCFIVPMFICGLIAIFYSKINNKISKKRKIGLFSKILPIICIIITCILSFISTIYFNIEVPILIIIGLSILIILSYEIMYRKDKKINSEYLCTAARQELSNSSESLKKLNKKYHRRGKNKITELEYIDIELKKINKSLKFNKFNLIVPLIFSIIATSFNVFSGNLIDSLLFFLIILIIEYIIFIPMYINTTKYNTMLLEKYSYFKENEIPIKKWK